MTMPAAQPAHSPLLNRLLAALPVAEFDLLGEHLQLVEMALGDTVYEPGRAQLHACFPTTAVVSLHIVTRGGSAAETAAIGREGVVGFPLFMGGDTTPSSAVVQSAGHGYRLDGRRLKLAFGLGGMLQDLLLRHTQALITQMAQAAACNRHHSVEQQLSRWLLTTLDRGPPRELVVTQELVANMLGVRRESVTESAGRLQQAGYIRYRRGHITVLDAAGLATRACECYGVVKREQARLLNDPLPRPATAALAGR